MCSTPKGSGGRPARSSAVNGLVNNMSAAEYSALVHRANESYERRQKELAKIRAARKLKAKPQPVADEFECRKQVGQLSLIEWFKHLFHSQNTQHL